MLAMDPCNCLSGERGFPVVFLFYFLHLPADGTPSFFGRRSLFLWISGASKHHAYQQQVWRLLPTPGDTPRESDARPRDGRACVGDTHHCGRVGDAQELTRYPRHGAEG